MIPANSRVVLIGDTPLLDRVRVELPAEVAETVVCVPPDDLLAPYDRETEVGAAQRRQLERVYASLIGRILVRLLVVNLIPERLKDGAESPLLKLRAQWDEIQRRMVEFLHEGSREGVRYVTVLVTEDGDWTEAQRQDLLALIGNVEEPALRLEQPGIPMHRCYLITRMLELGQGEVFHSVNVWPVLTANLIEFLSWRVADGSMHAGLADPGLFAWRTVRLVSKVDQTVLKLRTRAVLERLRGELFNPTLRPLFPTPIEAVSDVAARFTEPAAIVEACDRISMTPWNQIGTLTLGGGASAQGDAFPMLEMVAGRRWAEPIQEFAIQERRQAAGRRDDRLREDLEAVHEKIELSRDLPSEVFPGALPPIAGAAKKPSGDMLAAIVASLADTRRMERRLQAFWKVHGVAGRYFVPIKERLFIGLLVSAAISYLAILSAIAVGRLLPADVLDWSDGVMFAVAGSSGAFLILCLSHRLQRARGENARDRDLELAARNYVESRAASVSLAAETLRAGARFSNVVRRQAVRMVLHHRLRRVERLLASDFQPSTADTGEQSAPTGVGDERRLRALVDIEVGDGDFFDGTESEKLETESLEQVKEGFLRGWQRLILEDRRKVGFLPSQDILRHCVQQSAILRKSVLETLRESVLNSLQIRVDDNRMRENFKQAVENAQLESGKARFFSVNLMNAAEPHSRWWCREEFRDVLSATLNPKDRAPYPSGNFDPGVIAVWHGEVKLDFSQTNANRTLRFVAAGSEPNPVLGPRRAEPRSDGS